jgi:hypothetical protein
MSWPAGVRLAITTKGTFIQTKKQRGGGGGSQQARWA